MVDGEPRIVADHPVVTPVEDLLTPAARERVHDVASGDRRRLPRHAPRRPPAPLEEYRYVHAARKVVGVGSVGTRAWIMLLLGRDGYDPLFLQFKEAQPSVLEPVLGPSAYENHGRRVVEGQRLMQSASDVMLGWVRTLGPRRRARATSTSASSGTRRAPRSSSS